MSSVFERHKFLKIVSQCANILLNVMIRKHFYPSPEGEGGFWSRQDSVRRLASGGWRPASNVTFSCGLKNSRSIYFEILTRHSEQHGDVQLIFQRCYQNSKSPSEFYLQKNLWAQKRKNLKSEIIQISLPHPPPYGDVEVTFLRFK